MKLADLPTPCLVLDRGILQRNLDRMAQAAGRLGVGLRPHMKTAKSIDVAQLAIANQFGGITVSTLAEAEYFLGHGITDILYAVGITPQKLEAVVQLNASGGAIMVVTDDAEMARVIAAAPRPPQTLVEIDCGEHRGGLSAEDPAVLELAARLGRCLSGIMTHAARLGRCLSGIMTHAGHSYSGRSIAEMEVIAQAERDRAVRAADRLRAAGFDCPIVSMGSSPTVLHATDLAGLTEVRAGVYMFGDLFQYEIATHGIDDIALTVLSSVIGRRPAEHKILVDAGGLALSKDRSTEAAPHDWGFGLLLDARGQRGYGRSLVTRAYQEHGIVDLDPAIAWPDPPIGAKLRIAPNHACMTAAAHDRYFVVDGGDDVVAIWPRVNGW